MADTVLRLDPEIIIGRDTVNRAGALCGNRGSKILIATEQGLYENNQIERLTKIFEDAGLETILFDEIAAQATADVAENAAALARGARCDLVVGFGGLKTQYMGRLISILASSRLGLFDLLDGQKEESAFLPFAAIPTAGADPFLFADHFIAVDPRDRFVKLVKCPRALCAVVILDPGLSESLSGKFASIAAFDGLCATLEAYCSAKSNFLSDAVLEQAITLYARMIQSYGDGDTLSFDFLSSSINAGFLMSLGASVSAPGIGAALAYALNGKFPVAKSWCSTVLLPYIMEKLVAARPEKMAKAAALMGEPVEGASRAEAANMAVDTVRSRMGQLAVPARLKDFDLSLDRLVPAAEAARNLEFVAFSPWTVGSDDAYDLLKQAF
ncbi:MAG: iron-containing alcohol dehydrogenase [Treponema sp.]|nr:iron-containing alcohol dehydrogenase [Treponema sp.]